MKGVRREIEVELLDQKSLSKEPKSGKGILGIVFFLLDCSRPVGREA